MAQTIITSKDDYKALDAWIKESGCGRLFLVCDDSFRFLGSLRKHLELLAELGLMIIRFQNFQPNPLYESVVEGVDLFRKNNCDAIAAVGGGSAMDVAKCIKLFSTMSCTGENGSYLKQEFVPNQIPFLAVPTTAGTGSEATRYAVIYYKDVKQSVTQESILPGTILLDPKTLVTLPEYQRKCTMMDAFCHAIESFWSVNSTEESKAYSREAIRLVLEHMEGYLRNTQTGNEGMLMAAHIAGKAINITQTTAGHAMCYKLTSLFHIAHGHAAALCDRILFPWMLDNLDRCIDVRGEGYLRETFEQIAEAMGYGSPRDAAQKLNEIFQSLGLSVPTATEKQFDILKRAVNPDRMKNHPILLDIETIDLLYHKILKGEANEG